VWHSKRGRCRVFVYEWAHMWSGLIIDLMWCELAVWCILNQTGRNTHISVSHLMSSISLEINAGWENIHSELRSPVKHGLQNKASSLNRSKAFCRIILREYSMLEQGWINKISKLLSCFDVMWSHCTTHRVQN